MKTLTSDERRLGETTAQVIVKATEIGLPEHLSELVTPRAIQFLARAHLELLGRVEKLHQTVGDLEDLAAQRDALAAQVQSIQGSVDQIVRIATEESLRDGVPPRGDTAGSSATALWKGLLDKLKEQASTRSLPTWIGRRRAFPQTSNTDMLRVVPSPAEIATLSGAELLALYCRVMREVEGVFTRYESYIVRVWDGLDGCWSDCTGEVGRDEALQYWAERTNGGTRHVAYDEVDYYRIFPGSTRMRWDGTDGKEMHR